MRRECTFLLLLMLNSVGYLAGLASDKYNSEWWHTAVFYHIYPRSFMDSDGDGVGDLKGINEKSRHLRDIGVNCVCLSPIFQTPTNNFGYDTSNYQQIDSVLGTIKDLILLKKMLHFLDIKLVLDFVPTHSSDQHEWFKKSVRRIDPYTDYYVWMNAKIDRNGARAPPNNWQNLYHNSVWTWNEKRGQYYLHKFGPEQPDLNYRNKKLVEEMKDVLRFWLDFGVDGYRFVAAPFLLKDPRLADGTEREEALVGIQKNPRDKFYHGYAIDELATHDMIHQFRDVLDEYNKKDGRSRRVLIAEAYAPIENVMKYYGNQTNPGAHVPFNFGLINDLDDCSKAADFKDAVGKWLDNMPEGQRANWAIGNNRRSRVATRFGGGMIDAMNALNLLLPGAAFTYAGEEIGMTDGPSPRSDDPAAAIDDGYRVLSETLSPYQWNASTSAGFSSSPSTWLPVNPDYAAMNLDGQKESKAFGHYHVYKRLIRLRKTSTVRHGTYEGFVLSERVFAFSRSLQPSEWSSVISETYLVVMNVGSQDEDVDISRLNTGKNWFVHTTSTNMDYHKGAKLDVSSFRMKPKSVLVLSKSKMDMNDDFERRDMTKWLMSSSPSLLYSSAAISLVALWCTLANSYGIFDF